MVFFVFTVIGNVIPKQRRFSCIPMYFCVCVQILNNLVINAAKAYLELRQLIKHFHLSEILVRSSRAFDYWLLLSTEN